jgi:hypothetical protein
MFASKPRKGALRWWCTILITTSIVGGSTSAVGVTLKSKALSRKLGSDDSAYSNPLPEGSDEGAKGRDSSVPSHLSSPANTPSKAGNVALDLSGKFDILVASPAVWGGNDYDDNFIDEREEGGKEALFPLRNKRLPDFHVGAQYNFNAVWYGVTRCFASIRSKAGPQRADSTPIRNLLSSLDSQYTFEKGVFDPRDYSTNLVVRRPWPTKKASPPWVSVSQSTSPIASSAIGAGLGLSRFLDVSVKVTGVDGSSESASSNYVSELFSTKMPKIGGDGWIPDLNLNPLGQLTSSSDMGRYYKGCRYGARLRLRKQLSWSSSSSFFDFDGMHNTNLQLDIEALNQNKDHLSTLKLGTSLRDFRDTKASLSSEFLFQI